MPSPKPSPSLCYYGGGLGPQGPKNVSPYKLRCVYPVDEIFMSTDLPLPYSTDRDSLERDSDVTFFVAGGPGGQHRNKVATGVRLHHRPSGVVVSATERRSQSANREMAYARLAERLHALQATQAARIATRPGRAAREHRRSLKRQRSEVKQSRRSVRDE